MRFLWVLAAVAPLVICDFSQEAAVGPGEPMLGWMRERAPDWHAEFGTPAFFSIADGRLRLVAKRGPLTESWNPRNLTKREDKVILRVRGKPGTDLRVAVAEYPRVEVRMAPVRLPGKGADVTDSDKNDACFYLLVGFDGPLHRYRGTDGLPDTIGYVWADAPFAKDVGRDPDYDEFLRYLPLGSGSERLGDERTFVRDIEADFRAAFPERAGKPVPDVVRVGLMIDANTVESEAESMLRSVRFLPAAEPVAEPR
jgi:hypothetical protein